MSLHVYWCEGVCTEEEQQYSLSKMGVGEGSRKDKHNETYSAALM